MQKGYSWHKWMFFGQKNKEGGGANMKRNRKSLSIQLILSFLVTSIIPIVIINLFSYWNILDIVNENNNDLMKYNLNRTKTALDISIESYEDVLYQIYSNDEVIQLINRINQEDELVVCKNQLRRTLHGYFYVKDYIKDISVITENGTLVFYDTITGSTTRNSWISGLGISQEELYARYAGRKGTHFMPTGKTGNFQNESHYLFHMVHQVVDFKKQNKEIGLVILTIDEEMLENICTGGEEDLAAYCFIVDQAGKLVSFQDKSLLGKAIELGGGSKMQAYEKFAKEQSLFSSNGICVDAIQDEKLGWEIVNVSSQEKTLEKIGSQQKLTFLMMIGFIAVLLVIILFLAQRLTKSVKSVVKIMQSASEGRLQERVQINRKMPKEVEVIARQYNDTMDRLVESMEREKELNRQWKDAEITALEAQINPHFLYNTLDTINWIAIGKKEFDVSRAITALARILRYGIDNSNGIVTIREEYEWLMQYLLLQQNRLKDELESIISIPPEAMEVKVHKLLFQPFIENSFVHGFEGVKRKPILDIRMELTGNTLKVRIKDNGKGMPEHIVEAINQGLHLEEGNRSCIGMQNALYRMKLYYEGEAQIHVESQEGAYTKISMELPAG